MTTNVGTIDRALRVIAGIALIALAATGTIGVWGYIGVVLVASGTATLETALYRRPMVIAYRMPPSSYWIMRQMGTVRFVGLPNILAGEALVPELIQQDATGERLAEALLTMLDDTLRCDRLRERFARMHAELRRDTPRLAAEAICATMRT